MNQLWGLSGKHEPLRHHTSNVVRHWVFSLP